MPCSACCICGSSCSCHPGAPLSIAAGFIAFPGPFGDSPGDVSWHSRAESRCIDVEVSSTCSAFLSTISGLGFAVLDCEVGSSGHQRRDASEVEPELSMMMMVDQVGQPQGAAEAAALHLRRPPEKAQRRRSSPPQPNRPRDMRADPKGARPTLLGSRRRA